MGPLEEETRSGLTLSQRVKHSHARATAGRSRPGEGGPPAGRLAGVVQPATQAGVYEVSNAYAIESRRWARGQKRAPSLPKVKAAPWCQLSGQSFSAGMVWWQA